MNPLQKARQGAGVAWRKSRDGSKRTASWVTGSISGGFGKAKARSADATSGVRDAIAGAADRSGGSSLWRRAKADGRIGAALILAALLLIAWIAWTVYVWSENGAAAGLGVLISWPAAIAAIALIAAPLVAAAVLIRRMTAEREPALAGGPAPAAEESREPEVKDSEDEADDDEESHDEDEDEDPDEDEDEDPDEDEDEDPVPDEEEEEG